MEYNKEHDIDETNLPCCICLYDKCENQCMEPNKIIGQLTDCVTGKTKPISLRYRIEDSDITKIFYLHGGPTGYESFYITCDKVNLMKQYGWIACIGTKFKYDKLYISSEEMRRVLKGF